MMKKVLVAAVLLPLCAATFALAAPDERRTTEAILADAERDDAHKNVTQDLTKRSRAAMERAKRMREAGDEAHARLADALAREWAEAAQDLARAVDAEAKATVARTGALDAGARAEHERAMLEEGIARSGRLRALIDQVDREKGPPPRTSAAGADAGAVRNAKPGPADAGGDR